MTLTPGAYLKHRRTAAGLSVADVAALLSTVPRIAEHARVEQLELIEADASPATFSTVIALRSAYFFDLQVLSRLAEIQLGSNAPPPRLCRICSCSELDACRGSCSWVAQDLCSTCAGAGPALDQAPTA